MRDLLEAAGLVAAVVGAFLSFGPVALIVGGLGLVVFVEVTDGSS